MKKNNIVVLGGSGLIGESIVTNLLKKKYNVIVLDLILSRKNKINLQNKKIDFIKFDITNIKDHKKTVSDIFNKYIFIDGFINCSYPTKIKKNKIDPKKIKNIKLANNLTNHLFTFYNLSFLFCDKMSEQNYGSVVNVSSIYGVKGPKFSIYKKLKEQMSVSPDYAMIKSGIIGFTKYLCSMFGEYNVRVNSVSPGGVLDKQDPNFIKEYTKHVPLSRMANPDDIALPIIFLCSEESKYITGVNLLIDGGWSAI